MSWPGLIKAQSSLGTTWPLAPINQLVDGVTQVVVVEPRVCVIPQLPINPRSGKGPVAEDAPVAVRKAVLSSNVEIVAADTFWKPVVAKSNTENTINGNILFNCLTLIYLL